MRIERVAASFSCKVSRNYNSVEAAVTLEGVLDQNEDHLAALAALHGQAKAAVRQQLLQAGVCKAEVESEGVGK